MKKSLVAVAALAVLGGSAFAQSNVTLSGVIKGGLTQNKYSNGQVAASPNGSNTSVADGSSRFIIGGREDLGGGLYGIFQIDTRFRVDDNGGAPASSPLATGNTFVGLAGGFGSIRLGKLDTHYCLGSDEHGVRATALQASSCGILGFVVGSAGANAIANASRSTNLVRYDIPAFVPGLTGGVAYSTGIAGAGSDGAIGQGGKGRAWNVNAGYAAGPISLGASVWNNRAEDRNTTVARGPDQKAWTLTGAWNFGVAKVGLTYDESKLLNAPANAGFVETKRRAYSVPVTVGLGAGTLLATYTKASDAKVNGSTATNTGASLISVGYDHALSKRTSVGVSYAVLNNKAGASYGLYTAASLQGLTLPTAGQDQKQLYLGFRHSF